MRISPIKPIQPPGIEDIISSLHQKKITKEKTELTEIKTTELNKIPDIKKQKGYHIDLYA